MASNAYIKSLIWLVSFGGIGYGLMQLTEPSAEKIERIKSGSTQPQQNAADSDKKKALFMQRLQEAVNEPPIYTKSITKKD